MILDNISNAELYYPLHPLFQKLMEYVRTHDLSTVPAGCITLEGDDLFINVNDSALVSQDSQKLEVHRQYIDVHFPLSGEEVCGWSPLQALGSSDEPFNTASDFALYSACAQTYFTVKPGQFYIVYPEDAHAPVIGKGKLRKLVAKVRIKCNDHVS